MTKPKTSARSTPSPPMLPPNIASPQSRPCGRLREQHVEQKTTREPDLPTDPLSTASWGNLFLSKEALQARDARVQYAMGSPVNACRFRSSSSSIGKPPCESRATL